jgi:hypothetical protein
LQSQTPGLAPLGGQVAANAAALAAGKQADQNTEAGDAVSSQAQASLGSVGRYGLNGERSTPGAGTARPVHGFSAAEVGRQEGRAVQAQSIDAVANAPAWVRGTADSHETLSATGGHAGASGAAAAESGARATFAALDADPGSGTPVWIHAGAQRAEAGFEDPALGWVGVRADISAGGVHASLVPDSVEAARALGGHIAGLHAFLAEQHTPVETLTLFAPEGKGAALNEDQGTMQQGAGQHAGQGAYSEPQSNSLPDALAIPSAVSLGATTQSGRLDEIIPFASQGGVHISVMA